MRTGRSAICQPSATSICWADGIHLEARIEEQAQCILVIIGATPEGKKELVGFTDGTRESSQSWRDLLLDLKRRGLTTAPQIAVADGHNQLPTLIQGVRFTDGIEVIGNSAAPQAQAAA